MTIRINDGFKNLGMYAEALFVRELQLCEANKDEKVALFAEKVVENFGRASYDDDVFHGEYVAMGDQAIRLLDSLPPAIEKINTWIERKHSFPHTKAGLMGMVFVALDCAEKEEQYLKFASALMSPRNKKTKEEEEVVMDTIRKHMKWENFCSNSNRVKKFVAILRQMPHRAENPVFREMLHFIAMHASKEQFKELVRFHEAEFTCV